MSQPYIKDVLTANQKTVFIKLKSLKKIGVMAGGTALSLQLGHRRSYDFDIFTLRKIPLDLSWEVRKIFGGKIKIVKESENELTFLPLQNLKLQFSIIHLNLSIK